MVRQDAIKTIILTSTMYRSVDVLAHYYTESAKFYNINVMHLKVTCNIHVSLHISQQHVFDRLLDRSTTEEFQ